jgi:hypothetical protein
MDGRRFQFEVVTVVEPNWRRQRVAEALAK